ncbi:MAG: hypothetical protein GY926_20065 [bacterium]|nr:hypothetical protein [bacterium]
MRRTPFEGMSARLRVLGVLVAALLLVPVAVTAAGGPFVDDDDSMFEMDIEWMAAHGITLGCNPPTNDHYCPDANVTRGQMAAFMHRLANDQANIAYLVAADAKTDIEGQDFYETVLELEGLPAGNYQVIAKGEFYSSEIMTEAHPTCKLVAGHEFDTASPSVAPGQTVSWTLTAVTYMAEDNSVINLDCRDHGEMVTLSNTRITAVGVNEIVISVGPGL